ncbi:hypothetical protein Pfo_013805 [Paulownia fortunei]|nr:hypothetical protein Pfo_013805 [Paulownia fortunei]
MLLCSRDRANSHVKLNSFILCTAHALTPIVRNRKCVRDREALTMAESGSRTRKRWKLTIEDYIDFIHSRDELDLTYDQFNQIIDMHGFKKIHKDHKRVLVEAVSKMELMDITRSTTQDDGVSSFAYITLEEAVRGLKDLDWQECQVSSLLTLNAFVYDSATADDAVPEKPKRGRKKKPKMLSDSATTNEAVPAKPKRGRKKKPKMLSVNGWGIGDGVNSAVDDGATVAAAAAMGITAESVATCGSLVG